MLRKVRQYNVNAIVHSFIILSRDAVSTRYDAVPLKISSSMYLMLYL